MTPPLRVAAWSGPRNISTAMMRAWENRPDTVVVDEPFYAAYLQRTGVEHPGRAEVLASQPTDPEAVVAALLDGPSGGAEVQYLKLMSQHVLPGDDLEWTTRCRNLLLIRDPAEVVASYTRSRENCRPTDIGLLQQAELAERWGDEAPVLDAADVLRDPESALRWLCDWLGLVFTDRMLHWPAGPRESDGVWARYWYDAVQASTGFAPYRPRGVTLHAAGRATAEACRDAYQRLHERRVRL